MAIKREDTHDAYRWWRVLFGDGSSGVAFTERNARGAREIETVLQSSVSILLASLIFLFICMCRHLNLRLS